MNDFFDDLETTASRRREVEVGNRSFIIEASDPYGFWSVFEVIGSKEVPLNLGSFTTQGEARNAIKVLVSKPKVQPTIPKKEKN